MSIWSEYRCGAISYEEFCDLGEEFNREERAYEAGMYSDCDGFDNGLSPEQMEQMDENDEEYPTYGCENCVFYNEKRKSCEYPGWDGYDI